MGLHPWTFFQGDNTFLKQVELRHSWCQHKYQLRTDNCMKVLLLRQHNKPIAHVLPEHNKLKKSINHNKRTVVYWSAHT